MGGPINFDPSPAMATDAALAPPPVALRRLPPFLLFPSSSLTYRRCSLHSARCPTRFRVSASPPPDGSKGGDSFDSDFDPLADMEAKINRARDGVQIFFAVLFWMSLFFWASAWDKDDHKGSKKGGWFRK